MLSGVFLMLEQTIVKVAKGKTVKGRAWVLLVNKVQEWTYLYQNLKGFQDTYLALQKMGVDFPPPSQQLMQEQSRMNERRIDRLDERKKQEQQRPPNPNDPQHKLKESLQLLSE